LRSHDEQHDLQLEIWFSVGWVVPSALDVLGAALVSLVHHSALLGLRLDSSRLESAQMSVTVLMCSALADGPHLVKIVKEAWALGCAGQNHDPAGLQSSVCRHRT